MTSFRLTSFDRQSFRGYGVALATSALASAAWIVGGHRLEPSPFPIFIAAVMASSWYGGLGPGLLSIALGIIVSIATYFPHTLFSSHVELSGDLQLVVFVAVCAFMILLNTSLRRSEARARRAEERMAQLMTEREAARLEKEAVLSVVAHDLKTPLTTIKGFAQLLSRRAGRLPDEDREAVLESVGRIEAASTRMSALIDELVDTTRDERAETGALQLQFVDLVSLAEQAVREQEYSPDHRINLQAQVPTLVGCWDENRLSRVLDNLLSNAVKYSPDGGPIVVDISPDGAGKEAKAVVTVSDEGIGIPPDDIPHIFERFRRGSNAASIANGQGIGLAGAQQTVRRLGGDIEVQSELGKGSTLRFRLPLLPREEKEEAPWPPDSAV